MRSSFVYCVVVTAVYCVVVTAEGAHLGSVIQAVLIGMLIVLAGTIPRNLLFAANLRFYPGLPWAVPATAIYLWFFWRYLQGFGSPDNTSAQRHSSLRANPIPASLWAWSMLAGGLGIVALVFALRVVNRLIVLPEQRLPAFTGVPQITVLLLLLFAAPVAGLVEESAFRGYMQQPIERRYGLFVAILITGTMFAVAHLDFTLALWPYYIAVSAIYGTVAYLTNSILPAIVLHTCGNLYSNFDLWMHGKAEWQASSGAATLIWKTGIDRAFWYSIFALVFFAAAMVWAYFMLARNALSIQSNRSATT